jgi:hypothetical protein
MRPQIAPAQVSFLTSTLRSHGIDLRADVAPEFTITSPIKFGKRTRRVKICKNDDHIYQCKLRDLRVWFAQQSGILFYSVAKHTKHYGSCHLCRRVVSDLWCDRDSGMGWSMLIYLFFVCFCYSNLKFGVPNFTGCQYWVHHLRRGLPLVVRFSQRCRYGSKPGSAIWT